MIDLTATRIPPGQDPTGQLAGWLAGWLAFCSGFIIFSVGGRLHHGGNPARRSSRCLVRGLPDPEALCAKIISNSASKSLNFPTIMDLALCGFSETIGDLLQNDKQDEASPILSKINFFFLLHILVSFDQFGHCWSFLKTTKKTNVGKKTPAATPS